MCDGVVVVVSGRETIIDRVVRRGTDCNVYNVTHSAKGRG